MENLIYFHLGKGFVNWYGKVISFVDNINIDINDIYYEYNKTVNNVYYNKNCKILNSNEIILNELLNHRDFKRMIFN